MRMLMPLVFAILFINSVTLFAQETKPNILFILTDDMGYSDVGFNQLPESNITDIVSPNIDDLAEEGVIFSSAYAVHPFCGPSRAGILTGRYPHIYASQFNLAAFSEDGINLNETYFSQLLQNAGYYTGIMGKWHLGEVAGYQPNDRGFDEFYGFLGGGHYYFSDDFKTVSQSEWIMENYVNDPSKLGHFDEYKLALMRNRDFIEKPSENQYLTDMLTTEGIAFIDRAQAEDKPFFLFMSYNAPHTLLEAKDSDIAELEAAPYNMSFRTDNRATYSAMIYALDKQIKIMVDALKDKGLYDNTLIVFMSDNGGKGPDPIGGGYNSPLKGRKGDVHEGGYRVPMFMHWPAGLTDAPAEFDHVVSGLDLYPTFVSLAGGEIPATKELDGIDLIPHVKSNTDPRSEEALFVLRVQSPSNNIAVRQGKWKAKTTSLGVWQLFDLENDISESNPVSGQQEILDSLFNMAAEWSRSHIEPLWFDAPKYEFESKWDNNNMPNWEGTFPGYDFTISSSIWDDETLSLKLFPNPTSNTLNMVFGSVISQLVDVAIYDLNGQLVQIITDVPQTTKNTLTFEIENDLANGNYILAVRSDDRWFGNKFTLCRN